MILKLLPTGNQDSDSSLKETFEMAEIPVNHKANFGQCHRGNKQSVLFSSGWKVSDQFAKLMNPSIFPNTSKLHRSARKPYVPVLVIHAWPTFPSFPQDNTRGKHHCLPSSRAPLGFNEPAQPTLARNELPSWQKCAWPRFYCICPASIWKLALHVWTYYTEQPGAKFCSSLLRPEMAAAISQGVCRNTEDWGFSYSSRAEINHF